MDWRSSGTFWWEEVSQRVWFRIRVIRAYFAHLVVVLDERVYGFDAEEAFVRHDFLVVLVFKDVGADDGGEVVGVHFATALVVDL